MACIVAGELAERPLRAGLVAAEFTFEYDLGIGRHRQPVKLARNRLVGTPAVTARVSIFGGAVLDLVAAGEKQHGIETAADQHRAVLLFLEILLADQAAVLARRNPDAGILPVVRNGAIRS